MQKLCTLPAQVKGIFMVNKLIRKIRILVMKVTVYVVWHKYKKLFIEGNYEYKKFKKYSLEYLKESINIEKTGNLEE